MLVTERKCDVYMTKTHGLRRYKITIEEVNEKDASLGFFALIEYRDLSERARERLKSFVVRGLRPPSTRDTDDVAEAESDDQKGGTTDANEG